jgi:CheY-like chemotaxis protein
MTFWCLKSKNNQEKKQETIQMANENDMVENKKHLIVDDNSLSRMILKKYLEIYGCIVDESENGLDALRKIKMNGKYKVIWMDIKMPKLDGIDCTKYLREELQYSGIIIILSGYVDEMTIRHCYDVGVNHVMPKPFDKKDLQLYVKKYS